MSNPILLAFFVILVAMALAFCGYAAMRITGQILMWAKTVLQSAWKALNSASCQQIPDYSPLFYGVE
jgi:hypothetical protein